MPQKRNLNDEEGIATHGQGSISCRVQAEGSARKYFTRSAVHAVPGSKLRVSIGVENTRSRKLGRVARILAFVDPLTGNLVVRMGMWDVSLGSRGHEIGDQVVWESDVPVCKVDGNDDR